MENTLPAFEAAAALDVAVQEFDVRQLRCGALVCVHDEDFDRTSDAAAVLGAGKPVRACAAPPASGPPELRFTCALCFSPWQGAVLIPRG